MMRKQSASPVLSACLPTPFRVQVDAGSTRLSIPMEDGFARLLVHGLAQFYGLLSSSNSKAGGGEVCVTVYYRADACPEHYQHPEITW